MANQNEVYSSATAFEVFISLRNFDDLRSPKSTYPDIDFKSFNTELRIVVTTVFEYNIARPFIHLELLHYNKTVAKIECDLITDHYLANKIWYPISRVSFETVKDLFDELRIKVGSIKLKDYLSLLKADVPIGTIEFRDIRKDQLPKDSGTILHPEISNFKAEFYDYQILGYNWLRNISDEGFGCILGDEMGLGKTIQIIGLLLQEKNIGSKFSIVICPSSLMENWRREIKKFAPTLTTYIHSGNRRTGFQEVLERYDVIITSYDVLIRDVELLNRIEWNIMVCDEAQAIKNYESQRSITAKSLMANCRIAVSGTPMENSLSDIWSLFDFIVPEFLGTYSQFTSIFSNNVDGALNLEPLISPLILRRLVRDVAKDLPPRIDIPEIITMDEFLEDLYEEKRRDIARKYGAKATLVQIQSLRMLCCDPSLSLKDGVNYTGRNTKLMRLKEILQEIFNSNEKVLIFTSFTSMADIIEEMILNDFGCYVKTIDGRTPIEERQTVIDEFSANRNHACLVLNPRAAGTGLNITAANHVIHYNLEWNPAIEDQASARSHRRGQKRPVFIRRLYYAGSVEEFVNFKIEEKRTIASAAVEGVSGQDGDLISIYEALQFSPKREYDN